MWTQLRLSLRFQWNENANFWKLIRVDGAWEKKGRRKGEWRGKQHRKRAAEKFSKCTRNVNSFVSSVFLNYYYLILICCFINLYLKFLWTSPTRHTAWDTSYIACAASELNSDAAQATVLRPGPVYLWFIYFGWGGEDFTLKQKCESCEAKLYSD